MLRFFGKYAEGVRLNCYRRVVLLTLPLLPSNVMRRLEARGGLKAIDLVVMKSVQAIGRLLPNENEVEVILFDKRFKRYCSDLMNYGIQCIDKNSNKQSTRADPPKPAGSGGLAWGGGGDEARAG
ncbi:hypothetical protein [Vulcanisaeta distributa]|uniref:hypothetical protein n=1 Tax=Vulcanisaeta distributa TaxID=164451 RepID=UPI001FB41776|nr:hypothetical protein [Vulcanisaeta distributa]